MENITVIIKEFFDLIKNQNEFLYSLLQDGISSSDINNVIEGIDIKLPSEVYTLFGFKDGIKEIDGIETGKQLLFHNGYFMSFEKCLDEYKYSINELLFFKLFPIFDNGGGDFLFIDCDEKSETYNKILIHSIPLLILEPTVIYDSLESLFITSIRCFEENIYYYDEDDFLEIDFDKLSAFCSQLNPSSEFWKR